MKFAFIIMGHFELKTDHAIIGGGNAQIIGVSNVEEACAVARKLREDGVDCIELCGAFGEAGAKKVIDATEGKLAVGYVVHLPQQDSLYNQLFSK